MNYWIRNGFGLCIAAVAAQAMSFQPLGFQSMGMGGAGVASASGSMAAYYNPALLAAHDYTAEIVISGGTGVTDYRLVDKLDKLNKYDLTGTLDRIAEHAPVSKSNDQKDVENIANAQTVLGEMASEKSGLILTPGAALGIQWENFSIGIYATSEATALPVIDGKRLDLIVKDPKNDAYYRYTPETDEYDSVDRETYEDSSLEYALNNGKTYLQLEGVSIAEVPFSYGHAFETSYGTFGVGGSLKYMYGYTYNTHVSIDTSSGDISDSFDDRDRKTSAFGVDLGAFYTPNQLPELRIGIVGKNLNSPKFDVADDPVTGVSDEIKIDPMARAGVYYAGFDHWIDLALDMDLTSNKTFIDDYETQYIGGGINIHPVSWFSLRLGVMQNIADSVIGPVLTAGLGFGLKWFQLDVSAMMSTTTGEFDGETIPQYVRVNLALLSRW